jgi:molybdenum cofactor cytidylyltransferase
MSKAAIIVLAAGASTRMGRPKQLLDFEGKPLLRHSVEEACGSGCNPVVVVLGAHAPELRAVLEGLPVEVIVNDRWTEGMGTSIQAGLSLLADRDVRGAILTLVDQPFITANYLRGLATTHYESLRPIIASKYLGTVGVPALFAREVFPALMALQPDEGCKVVILKHVANAVLVECPEGATDIDTPEDYARAAKG